MDTIQKNVLLASHTTFGIGGPADYFVKAHSKEDLVGSILYAREHTLPFFVLGSGANILISDKGFRGLVIKNEAKKVSIANTLLTAESGAEITDLIDKTAKRGLSGLEHYAGIPSTVGGALWQNLHFLSPDRTYTEYIGSIIHRAEILTEDGHVRSVDREYFNFTYDFSILHEKKDIVLEATFLLTKEDPQELKKRIHQNILWREAKHPEGAIKTSAGSIFKKLEGYGAGRLIQQVGLKGFAIGGAKISEKHANFIVNTGNATAEDVLAVIREVKKDRKSVV